ncbi:hypothetical protein BDW74DRAFT_117829 [Aspergillus multicolor]|uniref:uncharacterized protein n=1 Tax=Aspergillus multicolor TaxID=41759 RepID=UPI003CCCCB9A
MGTIESERARVGMMGHILRGCWPHKDNRERCTEQSSFQAYLLSSCAWQPRFVNQELFRALGLKHWQSAQIVAVLDACNQPWERDQVRPRASGSSADLYAMPTSTGPSLVPGMLRSCGTSLDSAPTACLEFGECSHPIPSHRTDHFSTLLEDPQPLICVSSGEFTRLSLGTWRQACRFRSHCDWLDPASTGYARQYDAMKLERLHAAEIIIRTGLSSTYGLCTGPVRTGTEYFACQLLLSTDFKSQSTRKEEVRVIEIRQPMIAIV